MEKIIDFAHNIILKKVNNNDICVDMTIGNGNDTLFLCNICKFVYGFDIQQCAIDNTTNLLNNNHKNNYELFLTSHENVDQFVKEKVKAFIYNLGYLPKGDKSIATNYDSTIVSINKALNLLDNKGIIVLVIYSGHKQGEIESIEVEKYVKNLSQKEYEVVKYQFINQINNPPYDIVIERK